MKFSIQIGDLELRSCSDQLQLNENHTTAEIVKWQRETCYTVAYWKINKEGANLMFVGDRPLDCKKNHFWKLAKKGQKLLSLYM